MDIVFLNSNKLKITLERAELEALGLCYDELDYSDAQTRRSMGKLLERAKESVGFAPKGGKLLVEIFPSADKGCVVHFTCLGSRFHSYPARLALEPVVFAFADADALLLAAAETFARYSHRIYKSSLYRFGGGYRLVIYPLDYTDRLSVYFLSEFGRRVGEGEILAAYTEEHGRLIVGETALDTLSEYF